MRLQRKFINKEIKQLCKRGRIVLTWLVRGSRWRNLPSAEERNRIWWEHAMRETWDEGSAPTAMTRSDKKKQWKREFMLHIAPKLIQQRKTFVKKEVAMLRRYT